MATSTDPNASSKTWELSLYELNRTPQSIITDNTEIAVSPRSLHSELMCPICLDMLKVTMTTKECLHRFCQDCIITALRSGNKECPTCRKKLVSKRSLRPDPNFDALISKIYPSREDYEAQQERVMAKVGKQHNFSANIEETLRLQAANRARGGKKLAGDEESALAAAAAAAAAVHSGSGSGRASTSSSRNGRGSSEGGGGGGGTNSGHSELEDEEGGWEEEDAELAASPPASDVELVIKPLPHGERVDRSLNAIRYLKTTVQATVDHISKYLEMRYDFEHGGGGGGGGGVNGSSSTSSTSASEEQQSSLPSSSSPNLPSTSFSAAAASDTNSKSAPAASNSTAAATSSGEAQQPNSSSSGGSAEGGAAAGGDLSSTTSTSTSSSKKSSSPFAIFIAAGPGQFHPLPGDWSLTAVVDKYWKVNRPLELFYAYKMASTKLADPGASARW